MKEGSLEAPTRHPIDWNDPDFYDAEKLEKEMRRIFDICHGCRRCFNLCDSFPKLFDLVDESATGEVDSVATADFQQVVDACTLCDMCFMTKCPYVPPHEFNVDFPHLMLRHRAVEYKQGKKSWTTGQLSETDRNGQLAGLVAPLANWATKTTNSLTRPLMEKTLHIHREAKLPLFHGQTLIKRAKENPLTANSKAPAFGQKVVLYATCFGNYNNPNLGMAARAVLAHNGVHVEIHYPECCGMPHLEQGNLPKVTEKSHRVATDMMKWIDEGYRIVTLVPSCGLMIKQEWPLLVQDPAYKPLVERLAAHTEDICEYLVRLEKEFGLVSGNEGLKPLGENITIHISCHSRAQNMGQKAVEMLKLIPDTEVAFIERCSGHGGTWGIMDDNFETALKVGKPVVRQAQTLDNRLVLSECPLAGDHIIQGLEKAHKEEKKEGSFKFTTAHPIEILATAYGLPIEKTKE